MLSKYYYDVLVKELVLDLYVVVHTANGTVFRGWVDNSPNMYQALVLIMVVGGAKRLVFIKLDTVVAVEYRADKRGEPA